MVNMSNNMSSPAHRMSTPEASNVSQLRPPTSRTVGGNSHLRASADMATLSGSSPASRLRPSSDFYGQQSGQGAGEMDAQDKVAQQWITDIEKYEETLEEMAEATLDQDFKDELSAIEQWFRVLSEAERTAASYALLQQTSPVQIRFFIQVLQQMDKNHPMSSVLSPANFDKDPMSSRLSEAIGNTNISNSARNSMARNSVAGKRQSGLDMSQINAMFPDAAAAIATVKANYTSQHGTLPPTNRNSAALAAPTISGPDGIDGQTPASPWATNDGSRPKSSSAQAPMGQFVQPPPSAGLRSPRLNLTGNNQIQSQTVTASDKSAGDLPMQSPYTASGNWASMVNTPMVPNFQQPTMSKELANATAMKLAAVSTVNSRFALDDVKKYRRARSNDAPGNPLSPGMAGVGMPVMLNDRQLPVMTQEQLLTFQQQQLGLAGRRPNSPGIAMQGGFNGMQITSPHNNGFLTSPLVNGMGAMNLGTLALPGGHNEGYLSDHSDMHRGRSPRGRRGNSKPPAEDPTEINLLQDVTAWLRSQRLHKYNDVLKDLKWTELIQLDDKALDDRGVKAQGARTKLLKVFESIKQAQAEGKLPKV